MRMRYLAGLIGLVAAAIGMSASGALAQQETDEAKLQEQRCPKPTEFANVFSFGYGGDVMPKDDAKFEELLSKIKQAGFNTIHCTYTPRRVELCSKHGVKMMIDLLAAAENQHVYKTPAEAEALCKKLRGNRNVWGYNIWNESFGKMGAGRKRDILNVRKWDPTHPAYAGTYRNYGMQYIVCSDVFGYYDYHWKRGTHYNFPHLLAYSAAARKSNSDFYRWVSTTSGRAGLGNYNRSLYTANTSIACGLKGILWFLGTSMMNQGTLEWTTIGGDIIKVNKQIMPLSQEIMKIGNPTAVYSTPITRDPNNRDLPEAKEKKIMPPGLENSAFPADFWIKPLSGEFVMGVFKDDKGRDAIFVANHNAYAEQNVKLKLAKSVKVSMFSRKEGKWQPVAAAGGIVSLKLDQAGGELLRFGE